MNEPRYIDLTKETEAITTLAAGETLVSDAIPIGAFNPEGINNLCVAVEGADASLEIYPLMNLESASDDAGEFLPDIDAYNVLNEPFTATSGFDGNGKGNARVVLGACQGIKFRLVNNGSADLTITRLGFGWQ